MAIVRGHIMVRPPLPDSQRSSQAHRGDVRTPLGAVACTDSRQPQGKPSGRAHLCGAYCKVRELLYEARRGRGGLRLSLGWRHALHSALHDCVNAARLRSLRLLLCCMYTQGYSVPGKRALEPRTQPSMKVCMRWQGCARDGLCGHMCIDHNAGTGLARRRREPLFDRSLMQKVLHWRCNSSIRQSLRPPLLHCPPGCCTEQQQESLPTRGSAQQSFRELQAS